MIGDEHNRVKFGHGQPEKRLKTLQTANADKLTLIRVINGYSATEKWLRNVFREHRVRPYPCEWFHFCPEMLTIQPPSDLEPEDED